MLPVEAQMTAFAPSSTAFESATVMPPVFKGSMSDSTPPSLKRRAPPPRRFDKLAAGVSGVAPSRSVTIGVASVTGSHSR